VHSFSRSSELPVEPGLVYRELTLALVNAELGPLLRMTAPGPWAVRPIHSWPTGETLFSSWILLCGCVPLDRHTFALHSVAPGRGFDESSRSLVNRRWKHRREIESTEAGCRVTDTVHFSCRIPGLGYVLRPVYALVFSHRHRRLRSRYGEREVPHD
jgi:hypothetical protein